MKAHFVLLFVLALGVHCASSKKNTITIDGKEKELTIKRGRIFKVQLPMQSGTGFDWELASPVQKCAFVGSDHIADPKDTLHMMGAKQLKVMEFKTHEAGNEDIKFIYRRSFEDKSIAPADEKLLKLTIE